MIYFDTENPLRREDLASEKLYVPLYEWCREKAGFSVTTVTELTHAQSTRTYYSHETQGGPKHLERLAEHDPETRVTLLSYPFEEGDNGVHIEMSAGQAWDRLLNQYVQDCRAEPGRMYCDHLDELIEILCRQPDRWLEAERLDDIGFDPVIGKSEQERCRKTLLIHAPWLDRGREAIEADFER